MALNLMDRSLYFKGLLILSRIDKNVAHQENEILKNVGESLGFNKEFCESTINDVIENKHLKDEPFKFSNKQIANMFLRDAIKLAFCDSNLDEKEYDWIVECAKLNAISENKIKDKITAFINSVDDEDKKQLDVVNYDWQSFFLPMVKIRKQKKDDL